MTTYGPTRRPPVHERVLALLRKDPEITSSAICERLHCSGTAVKLARAALAAEARK